MEEGNKTISIERISNNGGLQNIYHETAVVFRTLSTTLDRNSASFLSIHNSSSQASYRLRRVFLSKKSERTRAAGQKAGLGARLRLGAHDHGDKMGGDRCPHRPVSGRLRCRGRLGPPLRETKGLTVGAAVLSGPFRWCVGAESSPRLILW